MKETSWFISLLICYLFPILGLASEIDFSMYVSSKLKEHRVAGVAIARVHKGEIAEVLALGSASTATNELVHPDSIFQVGSISKPVAAWAAMTLVRDGKLDLDAPISKYLSRWTLPSSRFEHSEVTLRRILSHTAGLTLSGYPGFKESESLPSIEESLSGVTNGSGAVKLFQAPGEGFRYSGGGYTLLQLIIEEVTGTSFNQYVQEAVFNPLGMTSSSYLPDDNLLERRVDPHAPNLNVMAQHHFTAHAAAALHTTARDIALFIQANVSPNPVLSGELIGQMHSEVADASFAKVGLGFFLFGGDQESKLVGHGGANQGWRADLVFNPESRSGIIVMTNSENSSRFLTDVRCHWDSQYDNKVLASWCQRESSERSRDLTMYTVMAVGLTVIAFLILLQRFVLVLRKQMKFEWPRSKAKLFGLIASFGVLLFLLIALFTPLGAYLLSGFPGSVATIDYVSLGLTRLLYAILALLLVLSICCLSGYRAPPDEH